ncbi:hypothetical protein H4F17_10025 [Vibrio cholerae]
MVLKHYLALMVLICSASLVGCKSEYAFSEVEEVEPEPVVLVRIEIRAREPIGVNTLSVAPLAIKIFNEQTVMAIGHYSDGTSYDFTDDMTWQILDTDIATIDGDALVDAGIIGETELIGTHTSGMKSDYFPVIVEGKSRVCGNIPGKVLSTEPGGGISDTGKDNAQGNCMKVVELVDANDGYRKWFTGSPSLAVLNAYGYTQDDTVNNTGRTYARVTPSTITGEDMARFNQVGAGVVLPGTGDDANAGVNGQYDRWCQELNGEAFAAKRTWRRATASELTALTLQDNPNSDNMYDRFGWPDSDISWTSTIATSTYPNRYNYVNLDQQLTGPAYSSVPEGDAMAHCVYVFQ